LGREFSGEKDLKERLTKWNTKANHRIHGTTRKAPKRYSRAKLPAHKNIEDFDFSFQPSIDKRTINDCLTCNFITEKRNIVFIGNPGTGNYAKYLLM